MIYSIVINRARKYSFAFLLGSFGCFYETSIHSIEKNKKFSENSSHLVEKKILPTGLQLKFDVQNDIMNNLTKAYKTAAFTATDPLYKKEGIYEGYDLFTLLKQSNIDINAHDMVIFEAKDGFKINIPSSYIANYHPFLAVRDSSLPVGKNWLAVPDAGRIIDGGPFYLMWGKQFNIPKEFWAFGVTKIILSTYKDAYGASAPVDSQNLNVMRGFQIFSQNCSACHSVNRVGGKLGPEMNVPMNFTERYTQKYFIQYASNPSAVVLDAKMGPYKTSSNKKEEVQKDLKFVWNYLQERKQHKICNSQESCRIIFEKERGN